jgi:Sulfotransferase family
MRQRLVRASRAVTVPVRRAYGLPRSFERVKVCKNPIFVIGSPRSGTTMLGWSLDHHSWLWTSGESNVIREAFSELVSVDRALEYARIAGRGSWLHDEHVSREELLARLAIGVNALYTSRSEGRRWLDHTPAHALLLDQIGDMFPGAVFIHVLRDGRQAVESMTHFLDALTDERRQSLDQAGWAVPWLDFEEACATWRIYVEAASAFVAANPGRCLTVRHDRITREPWRAFRDIYRFLGIPFEHGPVDYVRVTRVNTSFPDRPPGDYPNPWDEWSQDQRSTFFRIAGETLVDKGLAGWTEIAVDRSGEPVAS